jgi:type IV secretion system protein VirD4
MTIALLVLAYFALGDKGILGAGTVGIVSWIGFFIALGYWIGSAVKVFREKPTTFGSAEWATLPYLEDNGLIGTEGVRIGGFQAYDKIAPLHYNSDRHLLTIAPTRSGKGTTVIIPNLLTYRGSILVIDPKGENAMITAKQRAAMGQDIFVVDPWNIASHGAASRFNPIDWLDMNDIDITENAMLLADALVVPDDSGDRFWIEEAKALLQGLILYVATDKHEEGNRNLPRVRDLLLMDGDDMRLLYQRMLDSDHHIVASTGARCIQKDEKLMSNVIASAQAQTHFLDSARLRENLSASDFKFEDLKSKAMTIYLVLPADRLNAFSRWLRLLIQQAVTVNARNIHLKPIKPVLFILDELPALGRLTMVEQAFGLMAGFGMQLWGISQDLAMLKKIYGDGGYESLISNSGMINYFGSRDRLTAEYFSALCGVTTVWSLSTALARSFGTSSGSGGSGSSSSVSTTETNTATQRKLAFADELMRLPAHRQLVLIENYHPIIGTKMRWFDDPVLQRLGRNLHKN